MKTMGMVRVRWFCRMSRAVSYPSIPGMLTSIKMSAQSSFRRKRSASSPDPAFTSSCPRSEGADSSASRFAGRSSTRRILAGSTSMGAPRQGLRVDGGPPSFDRQHPGVTPLSGVDPSWAALCPGGLPLARERAHRGRVQTGRSCRNRALFPRSRGHPSMKTTSRVKSPTPAAPPPAPRRAERTRPAREDRETTPVRERERAPAAFGLDGLPAEVQDELAELVEVLKAVKQGDFTVRVPSRRGGALGGAGELLNDIISLSEHATDEL